MDREAGPGRRQCTTRRSGSEWMPSFDGRGTRRRGGRLGLGVDRDDELKKMRYVLKVMEMPLVVEGDGVGGGAGGSAREGWTGERVRLRGGGVTDLRSEK